MAKQIITKELVEEHIVDLPNRTDSELTHLFKCASSHGSKLFKPYEIAITKERKARGRIKLVVDKSIEEQVAEHEAKEAYLNGDTNKQDNTTD